MLGQKIVKELVQPTEIVDIMERAADVGDIETARSVLLAYFDKNGIYGAFIYNSFEAMAAISVVYQAGRLQGIREQRMSKAIKVR